MLNFAQKSKSLHSTVLYTLIIHMAFLLILTLLEYCIMCIYYSIGMCDSATLHCTLGYNDFNNLVALTP
jgi:hypothetical protein